eukprot:gene12334-13608_t
MPSVYADPRDFVSLKQIPIPSHVGLKITARCSTPVYTCQNPSRKDVARENYERRKYQVTQCGYKSVNYKPYKPVGEVFLDDKELILKALGQIDVDDDEQSRGDDDSANESSTRLEGLADDFNTEEENITIHEERTENLQNLDGMLSKGRSILNKVRLGISLFKVIEEERRKKMSEGEMKMREEEELARKSMRPASKNQDHEYDNDNIDITRFLVPSPTRTVLLEDNSDDENYSFELEENPPELSSKHGLAYSNMTGRHSSCDRPDASRKIAAAKWQRIGSAVSRHSAQKMKQSQKETHEKVKKNNSDNSDFTVHKAKFLNSNDSQTVGGVEIDASDEEAKKLKMASENCITGQKKIAKNKKYRNQVPRPFSPVFTNVNFYETESREYTFRQLCVINWILEAMSKDQQSFGMPPISTCWKLKDIKEDMRSAQKKVEKEKQIDPTWRSFLTNPNKFSKGRRGRRGTLLQRRVSVAPSIIRLLSASSSGTTTTTPLGTKTSQTPEAQNSESSTSEKVETRSKGFPQAVTFSNDNGDTHSGELSAKMIQTIRPVNPMLGTQKDKAFTVRDVVLAKNAFARRGSRKASTASIQRRKSTTKQMLEGFDQERIDNNNNEELQWSEKDYENNKEKVLAAAIASYGAISINKKVDKMPLHLRDKFDELSKENDLILHDNLEQRERTNVESMEKKFLALNVMSDVNKALNIMRSKGALKIESEEEKKARISEECSWYKSLLDNLPVAIRTDRNNSLVLDKIAKYGSLEGRKVSTSQFLKVLSLLQPWELCYPDISAAIEFVRDKVVKMDEKEFEEWFQARTTKRRK